MPVIKFDITKDRTLLTIPENVPAGDYSLGRPFNLRMYLRDSGIQVYCERELKVNESKSVLRVSANSLKRRFSK